MSKEQLETGFVIETAKREVVIAKGINNTRDYVNLPIDLVLVLIKQAERVKELENILNQDHRQEVLEGMYEQNKRYREALKNIYELAVYDEYDNTLEQIVSEVEKSLEGEE